VSSCGAWQFLLTKSVHEYHALAKQGSIHAMRQLATLYSLGLGNTAIDWKQAWKWCRKAADAGDSDAQFALASWFSEGRGVEPVNDTMAAVWLEKSAAQNNVAAMTNLGIAYTHGSGVKQDDTKAVALFRKAAAAGSHVAQHRLGKCYSNGLGGLPKDPVEAVAWWQKSAAQGWTDSFSNLAASYANGNGVEQSWKQATACVLKGACQGDVEAQDKLCEIAKLHLTGEGGFEKDMKRAKFLFRVGPRFRIIGTCFVQHSAVAGALYSLHCNSSNCLTACRSTKLPYLAASSPRPILA
jgi:TPR repeat protein